MSTDKIVNFATKVGLMKPNSVKKDDEKAKKRLDGLLDSPDYVAEEKLDGCRYKIVGARFFSSDNVEKTANFPHLVKFFEGLKMLNIVLDGEIYYPGKTSQYATHVTGAKQDSAIAFQEQNGYIQYMIYDILRTPKAKWTTENTYLERRKLLEYFYNTYVRDTEMAKYIQIVDMRREGKREYIQDLLDRGLEGAVLKKVDSKYHMGKKPMWQWMKIKQADDTDLIILGFEPATKLYTGSNLATWQYWMPDGSGENVPVTKYHYMGWIGKVVMGAYVDGVLTQICTVSGMDESTRIDMTENPDNYVGRVARTSFMEKTTDGYPRHPSFVNMHEGKLPQECTWEF